MKLDEIATKADIIQLKKELFSSLDEIKDLLNKSLSPDEWLYASDMLRYTHHTTPESFNAWAERNGIDYKYTGNTGTCRKWNKSQVLKHPKNRNSTINSLEYENS